MNIPAIATVLESEARSGGPRPNQTTIADAPTSVAMVSAFRPMRVAISPKSTTPVAPPTFAHVNTPAAALGAKPMSTTSLGTHLMMK